MAELRPDQPVLERIAIIEEALARALPRDDDMDVAHGVDGLCLWVRDSADPQSWNGHPLYDIARELERLLS